METKIEANTCGCAAMDADSVLPLFKRTTTSLSTSLSFACELDSDKPLIARIIGIPARVSEYI